MFTKLLVSGAALALASTASAQTSSRPVIATLSGQAAAEAFFSMADYKEKTIELHGMVITHRSNANMTCREAVRQSAKYSCTVFGDSL